jgi:hypothetical protein
MTVSGGIVILLSSAFLTKASLFVFFLSYFSCSAMHLKVRYQGVLDLHFVDIYLHEVRVNLGVWYSIH